MAEINLIKLSQSGGPSLVDVNFNGTLEGQADTTIPVEVNLTDGVNPVTPTSVVLTGNDLDIVIPAPVVPSGVLFKTVEPSQYTSYRTGDEGWRVQNGWYDYTPPTNPKSVAELDYTSANFFYVLKNPLIVNGVSSTTRFVDVNGVQAFSAIGNADLVVIDKLTGMMYSRTNPNFPPSNFWDVVIDGALSYSIVVNSITYDDWFLNSQNEWFNILNNFASTNGNVDSLTGITLYTGGQLITSTTNANNTGQAICNFPVNRPQTFGFTKVSGLTGKFIRNARNLITAP